MLCAIHWGCSQRIVLLLVAMEFLHQLGRYTTNSLRNALACFTYWLGQIGHWTRKCMFGLRAYVTLPPWIFIANRRTPDLVAILLTISKLCYSTKTARWS